MLQHGHRLRSLCNRIYYGADTHVPLHAQRLLRFASSDFDGYSRTSRVQVSIKTAMKKEQVRERDRGTRAKCGSRHPDRSRDEKCDSVHTPYSYALQLYRTGRVAGQLKTHHLWHHNSVNQSIDNTRPEPHVSSTPSQPGSGSSAAAAAHRARARGSACHSATATLPAPPSYHGHRECTAAYLLLLWIPNYLRTSRAHCRLITD